MLLGMWVIILFGEAISGAHFNPCITLVFMLRKGGNGKIGKTGRERLLGLFFIAAQFCGGICAGFLSYALSDAAYVLSPLITVDKTTLKPGFMVFASWVSETLGTFVFVFLFMICTDKDS
jgi:glycerol uptake facilitator-like aquaporin